MCFVPSMFVNLAMQLMSMVNPTEKVDNCCWIYLVNIVEVGPIGLGS